MPMPSQTEGVVDSNTKVNTWQRNGLEHMTLRPMVLCYLLPFWETFSESGDVAHNLTLFAISVLPTTCGYQHIYKKSSISIIRQQLITPGRHGSKICEMQSMNFKNPKCSLNSNNKRFFLVWINRRNCRN